MRVPTIIVLIGLPGSGKTEYANNFADEGYIVCSSDEMRQRLCGDINDQDHNQMVFQTLHKEIREHLLRGENVVYDACNINSKRRRSFLNSIKDIDCTKLAYVIAPPYNVVVEQNSDRDRVVPIEVINRMYKHWQTPGPWEGFDSVMLISMVPCEKYDISKYDSYDQNNPYHSHFLGEHMRKSAEFIKNADPYDFNMYEAALRHDSGKPFCASIDEKGISHYIGHDSVGAYDVLSDWSFDDDDVLEISRLINYHMYPVFWEKDDASAKYRKIWGKEFFDKIMLLHEADKASA